MRSKALSFGELRVIRDYTPAIGCLVLMSLIVAGTWIFLPQQIPLWFTYPWGEGQLAVKIFLWTLPSIGLVTIVANAIITKALPSTSLLLRKVLNASALLVNIMLLIAVTGILQSLL